MKSTIKNGKHESSMSRWTYTSSMALDLFMKAISQPTNMKSNINPYPGNVDLRILWRTCNWTQEHQWFSLKNQTSIHNRGVSNKTP